MRALLTLLLMTFVARASDTPAPAPSQPGATIVLVLGAPGEKEYGAAFETAAKAWEKACHDAGARLRRIDPDLQNPTNQLNRLKAALTEEMAETELELWLVLIGHGTFDGKEAKFNLAGPDLSASELAAWLQPLRRPLVVADTSSCSGPFLSKLSAAGRIIITATRSGYELNYARFGQYFSAAISNPAADLDKDGQVSVLEAFLLAAHDVTEFYKTEGRLATEHPLLDDNGDGLGTPPDWFRGVRAVKKAADGASLDGLRAHQVHLLRSEAERKLSPSLRLERNRLEAEVEKLRGAKEKMPAEEYYERLEKLLLDLAVLYEKASG